MENGNVIRVFAVGQKSTCFVPDVRG